MDLTKMQTTWNLAPLLISDDDPKLETKRKLIYDKTHEFIKIWKENKNYLKDPQVLRRALDDYEVWARSYAGGGDIGFYFGLRSSQDENNPNIKAKENQIEDFAKKIANEMRFFTHRLAKVDSQTQELFLNSKELIKYKHFLEKLFIEAKYLLSEDEEKILTLKSGPAYANWTRMTSAFLSKEEREIVTEEGKKEKKNFSEIIGLIDSTHKKVRDSAAAAFNDILNKYAEVAENEMNSILQNKKIDDELRKIERPDLTRHLADDIDSVVVDSLVEAVANHFYIAQQYYTLKAKLLGVKQLAYHERNIPYGNLEKKYSFDESVDLVMSVFNNLDPQFAQIFQKFIQDGSLDVYPRKGKRSGAFCAGHLITQPTYILLNHNDKLRDVLTLAHELGHGINNELIRGKQHGLYFGTPTSTAEVASTFMEDFVLQEILKKADEELKLSLLLAKLNDDISTIFRQIACYKLEMDLHTEYRKQGYLSKEVIGQIFQKNMSAYMGEAVEQSPGSENWWVYWNHIRYFFYVYSYSSGLLISKSLQNSVKQDPTFIEKVKEFLSAGESDSPKNIFSKMGIDITQKTFWNKGLQEIEDLLTTTEQLAKDLHKI